MDDLSGMKFGILTAILPVYKNRIYWQCLCECGNYSVVRNDRLKSGETTSCGCRRGMRPNPIEKRERRKNHPLYNTWRKMKRRCTDKNDKDYPLYGERGISVCERWTKSFFAFLEDMGGKPTSKHTLDRIDNNGNYEPLNCKWSTQSEQNRNQRNRRQKKETSHA